MFNVVEKFMLMLIFILNFKQNNLDKLIVIQLGAKE